MYAATAKGTNVAGRKRAQPQMTDNKPKVAKASLNICAQAAQRGVRERYRRIEVRAGDVTESEYERDERGSGREGVGEQRDGDVAAREPFAHDA